MEIKKLEKDTKLFYIGSATFEGNYCVQDFYATEEIPKELAEKIIFNISVNYDLLNKDIFDFYKRIENICEAFHIDFKKYCPNKKSFKNDTDLKYGDLRYLHSTEIINAPVNENLRKPIVSHISGKTSNLKDIYEVVSSLYRSISRNVNLLRMKPDRKSVV